MVAESNKMRSLATRIIELAAEIVTADDELGAMDTLWTEHDDPESDPGLQYEQSCKIDEMYLEFEQFSPAQLFLRRTSNLDNWVIRYNDGPYNLKDSNRHATPFIEDAKLYDSEEDPDTLFGVDKIMQVRDTT